MSCLNIIFINNEQKITLQAQSDMMFAELAYKYLQKTGITDEQHPQFIFNIKTIPIDSCQTLSQLKMANSSQIQVILGNTIIGAL